MPMVFGSRCFGSLHFEGDADAGPAERYARAREATTVVYA